MKNHTPAYKMYLDEHFTNWKQMLINKQKSNKSHQWCCSRTQSRELGRISSFFTETRLSWSNVAIFALVDFHDPFKRPVTSRQSFVIDKQHVVLLQRRLFSSPFWSQLKDWNVLYEPALLEYICNILCTTPLALRADIVFVKQSCV